MRLKIIAKTMMDELTKLTEGQEEEDWISVSDLMAGLLMIFILIAILSILPNQIAESEQIGEYPDSVIERKEENIKRLEAKIEAISRQIVKKEEGLALFEAKEKDFNLLIERAEENIKRLTAEVEAINRLIEQKREDLDSLAVQEQNLIKLIEEKKSTEDSTEKTILESIGAELHEELMKFSNNKEYLRKWNAELFFKDYDVIFRKGNAEWVSQSFTLRFTAPEVLFRKGSSKLEKKFENALRDFFPRYLEILHKERFRDSISGIWIEGHASSALVSGIGIGFKDEESVEYKRNISLNRAEEVKKFVLKTDISEDEKNWVTGLLIPVGLSDKWAINGDDVRSRRVEFKIYIEPRTVTRKVVNEPDDTQPN